MSGRITPHQVALACGTAGAYVDVTSYVEFGEGVTYTYGKSDQFQDAPPGVFGFTLNNQDGRFTPGNTATLATPLVEGMGVSWLLGTRLVHGTILSFEIPPDEAKWDQIVIHCDDLLGTAARFSLTTLPDMLSQYGGLQLQWLLDESSGATGSAEKNANLIGAFNLTRSNPSSTTQTPTYGVQQVPGLPGTAITLTAAPGETNFYGTPHNSKQLRTSIPYPKITAATDKASFPSFGWWGFWVYPGSTINFAFIPYWSLGPGYADSFQIRVTPSTLSVQGGVYAPTTVNWTSAQMLAPQYVHMQIYLAWQTSGLYWASFAHLFVNGVSVGQAFFQSSNPAVPNSGFQVNDAMLAAGTAMQPVEVAFSVSQSSGATGPVSGTVQRITHSYPYQTLEQNALYSTEDQRRAVIDTIMGQGFTATYAPAGPLSSTPVGFPDVKGRSALDVFNDIVRTEAGHIFCQTTGTLTAPVEQIILRARDRPQTPKVTFQVTDGTAGSGVVSEIEGLPTLARDLTNVIESLDVQGPTMTVTVKDTSVAAITTRFITSGQQETILATDRTALQGWGYDRINRAKNTAINVRDITIDAFTTPTDRSADLLGLVPGDRVRLTGFPAARTGYASWDGWLLSAAETHTFDGHRFRFTFAPCLPPLFVLDGDPLVNAGDITLTAACTATDTTLQVVSATGQTFATPCVCKLGAAGEQIQVTAATATTLTVVRGYNGTTAIAHTAAAVLEVVPVHYLAF